MSKTLKDMLGDALDDAATDLYIDYCYTSRPDLDTEQEIRDLLYRLAREHMKRKWKMQ